MHHITGFETISHLEHSNTRRLSSRFRRRAHCNRNEHQARYIDLKRGPINSADPNYRLHGGSLLNMGAWEKTHIRPNAIVRDGKVGAIK